MKLTKMLQYGQDNWIFLILKTCNNEIDRKRLERMYIKYLNPDLNKFKKQRNPNKQMKGDLLNISTFSCNNETEIILDLDGLYKNNSGVKLEIEEYGENITFLETKIWFEEDILNVEYFNKNEKTLVLKKQKITRFKHYNSYEPKEQKLGMVIGNMLRISRLTINKEDLLHAIITFIQELKMLNYPNELIKNALYKMYLKTEKKIWNTLKNNIFWLGKKFNPPINSGFLVLEMYMEIEMNTYFKEKIT